MAGVVALLPAIALVAVVAVGAVVAVVVVVAVLSVVEGLLWEVAHSVNRHILFLRNRKPLLFSFKNRHRPTGRTIILITDLLTALSKFFAVCKLNNRISPHKNRKILRTEQMGHICIPGIGLELACKGG